MISVAICDDMENEAAALADLLREYANLNGLNLDISYFNSGFLFLDGLKHKIFHLCFLDIYMPSFTGLDTAKELRSKDKETKLIFCTSSREHALDGYGVQAVNYLVKPLEKDAFFVAMDGVLGEIQREKEAVLWVSTANGLQKLPHYQICYGAPEGHYSRIVLKDNSVISCRLTFTELCECLQKYPNFNLISRSTLLNFDTVVGMEQDDFLLITKEKIAIPRRKKKEITQTFLDYSMTL